MYPVNQVILGGDSMFNNLEDIDLQIQKMEAYRQRLKQLKDTDINNKLIWDEIDAEINPLSNEQKNRLSSNEEYIIIYNEITVFSKTFSSLLKHNVFITDSMEILTKITRNEIYKVIMLDTITNLAKGEKISASFKDHWAVPVPAYEMIVTGERTGQLAEMLEKVSEFYQDMHATAVGRLKTFIEPILIVMLTVIVGVIILSVIVPMFALYNAMGV